MIKKTNCCEVASPTPKNLDQDQTSCHSQASFDKTLWGSLISVITLFVLHSYYDLSGGAPYDWIDRIASTAYHMVHTLWFPLLIGIFFIGFLSKVPKEFIIYIFGYEDNFTGLLRATGAGVLLDLCSHGILMVGVKLYERGVSAGKVITFLLSSPWNSFSLTLILIGLIGFKWTLAFIFLSMVVAIITGYIFSYLIKTDVLPKNPNTIQLPQNFNFWKESKNNIKNTDFNAQFFKEITINGFKDSRIVLRWTLFGITLASLLQGLLEPEQFKNFFGPTFVGLMVTIFIATILEVCSEGSAPIAANIHNLANAPGNAFVFLMAGVATDYTEVMILKDTTKSWKLALFLPLVALPQIILIGSLINLARV